MSSTTESLVQRDVGEIWTSGGNLDTIDDIVSDDFVFYGPMGSADLHGPDEYREFAERFRAGFSNMVTEIEETIAQGERTASRFTMRATHDGEFMGIEPTNREVELKGVIIERAEDGKIEEKRVYDDRIEFFTQLGALEPPEELKSAR